MMGSYRPPLLYSIYSINNLVAHSRSVFKAFNVIVKNPLCSPMGIQNERDFYFPNLTVALNWLM